MEVDLTAAHWVYLAGVVVILATMILRKNIVVPAVAITFLTALVYSQEPGDRPVRRVQRQPRRRHEPVQHLPHHRPRHGDARRTSGAGRRPARWSPRSAASCATRHIAFWGLAVVTYFISLFFWPTPAVPLIGAVLIPVAIRAGLPAMGVGLVVAIAGQGMALSSDYVIRVAPGLSAKAAGANIDVVADRAMVLSLITGGVALTDRLRDGDRGSMRQPSRRLARTWELGESRPVCSIQDEDAPASKASRAVLDHRRHGRQSCAASISEAQPRPGPARRRRRARSLPSIRCRRRPVHLRGRRQRARGTSEPVDPRWGSLFAVVVPLAYLALIVYMLVAKFSDSVPDLRRR